MVSSMETSFQVPTNCATVGAVVLDCATEHAAKNRTDRKTFIATFLCHFMSYKNIERSIICVGL